METKTLHLPLLKASTAPGGVGIIVGYASVFGLKDEQNDIVPRGAFAAALAGQKSMPSMLWMHDITRPCGTWIKMAEDSIGLLVRGRLSLATKLGRDAYDLVKQGAVTGLSIGYRIKRSSYDAVRKARVLHEIILDEVSLVTLPANPAARISGVKHVKALGVKYSDNQPRVPAGNSDGGQWSDTGAGSGSTSPKPYKPKPIKPNYAPIPRTHAEIYRLDPPLRSVYPVEAMLGITSAAISAARNAASIAWNSVRATDVARTAALRVRKPDPYYKDTIMHGKSFSAHAVETMKVDATRKASPSLLVNTLRTGIKTPAKEDTTAFHDPINKITVVFSDRFNRIVTYWRGKP